MTKLYIANCTQQVQEFTYRLPEMPRPYRQTIDVGTQILLAGKDLSMPAIDGVLEHHERYGLVKVEDAIRSRNFSGLVYSLDRPVPAGKMYDIINHYKALLYKRGEGIRQAAAVATNEAIENMLPSQQPVVKALEMSFEEEGDGGPDGRVSEGLRVTRDVVAGGAKRARGNRARAAAH